jgi:hypothetical protein
MIKHIVLFDLKDGIGKGDPRVSRAFAELRALEGKIPLIRQWEVGENLSERPIATDFGLYSGFDSSADLAAYIDHPSHREVVKLLKEICTWRVCDYEA